MNQISPSAAIALTDNLALAKRRMRRVIRLHYAEDVPGVGDVCMECSCEPHIWIYWPCQTVRILTGEAS